VVRAAGWGCGGSCSRRRHKDNGIAQAWGSWTLARARTVRAEGQVARVPGAWDHYLHRRTGTCWSGAGCAAEVEGGHAYC
jgi:hypothetical protein